MPLTIDLAELRRRPVGFAGAWLILAITAVVVLGTDLLYLRWRERSLQPLVTPIDLTRPGAYSFEVGGFHSSRYHPEFMLHLDFPAPADWDWGQRFERIWGESAPEVVLDVFDSEGRRVLHEAGAVTRDNEWIVTGSPGFPAVEVYKFAEFTPRMFSTYRVSLRVVNGSRRAAAYQPRFRIATVMAYQLLPSTLIFLILVAGFIASAVILAIAQAVHRSSRTVNGAA
jgi:hypothetical protein